MTLRPSKRTATVLVLVVTLLLAGCTGPGGGATTPDNATGTDQVPVDAGTADQTPAPGDDEPVATDTPTDGMDETTEGTATDDGTVTDDGTEDGTAIDDGTADGNETV